MREIRDGLYGWGRRNLGAIRNNGGGHYNHSLFWKTLTPGGAQAPTGALAEAIDASFGSFDTFKEQFANAATTRFGSGWAWLIVKEITNLSNNT